MKYLTHFSVMAITLISPGFLIVTGLALDAVAHSAIACNLPTNPATTGGMIQQEIGRIARCNVNNYSATPTQSSFDAQNLLRNQTDGNTVELPKSDDEVRSTCTAIPRKISTEDYQYRAALEHCKFGS
jgi:hypothetical protein